MLPQKPKSKLFDARELAVKKRELAVLRREAELNEPKLLARIEILNKQISQKENDKVQLDKDILLLNSRLENASESNKSALSELKDVLELKSNDITALEVSKRVIADSIKVAKVELKEIKDDIHNQTIYFAKQQETINETINQWNDQLKEFQEADSDVQAKKASINRDIIRLEQDKIALEDNVKAIEEKNIELDSLYREKSSSYKAELANINKQISDGEQSILEIELKNKARIELIESKIQSVLIRERAVQKSELELVSREKKLNMRLGLSKMSIDDILI